VLCPFPELFFTFGSKWTIFVQFFVHAKGEDIAHTIAQANQGTMADGHTPRHNMSELRRMGSLREIETA